MLILVPVPKIITFKQKFSSILEFEAYLDALNTPEQERQRLKNELLLNVIRKGECCLEFQPPCPIIAN